MSMGKEMKDTAWDVFCFYPNLVGYVRVTLVLLSMCYSRSNWIASILLYLLAFIGDALDGIMARRFNQTSTFGGVLDMVTDRLSTASMLLVLSHYYDHLWLMFLGLILLDISSHWFHLHSMVCMGKEVQHKAAEALKSRGWLVRVYYGKKSVFTYCCIGTELLYLSMYMLHFVSRYPNKELAHLTMGFSLLCIPAWFVKQVVNVVQFCDGAYSIAEYDCIKRCNKKL